MPYPDVNVSSQIQYLVAQAQKRLPPSLKNNPWSHPELRHGLFPLSSEVALDCYMAAYGIMHSVKIQFALDSFPFDELPSTYELYDWGCGQGLATIEFLHRLTLLSSRIAKPNRITLVEPSGLALIRAVQYIGSIPMFGSNTKIRAIECYLPTVTNKTSGPEIDSSVISEDFPVAVHLFSNVLDVPDIDLKKLAGYITSKKVCHYFLCVGPCNAGEKRIEAFSNYFKLSPSVIFNRCHTPQFKQLENEYAYTCSILGFRADCQLSEDIKQWYPYYPPVQFYCGYCPDILKVEQLKDVSGLSYPCSFEVLAPFDMAAECCPEPHPVLAVLNNIVCRGLPSKSSPFLERNFASIIGITKECEDPDDVFFEVLQEKKLKKPLLQFEDHALSSFCANYDKKQLMTKICLCVARIQKTVIQAMLYNRLALKKEWRILAIERDVPCCVLAMKDLEEMFDNLTEMSVEYRKLRFPKIKIEIVSPNYSESAFHFGADVYKNEEKCFSKNSKTVYDLVLDIAITSFCDPIKADFSRYSVSNQCYFIIRSSYSFNGCRKLIMGERIEYLSMFRSHKTAASKSEKHALSLHDNLRYFLKLLFRKRDFRPGQLPILDRALRLKSVIGLLPTGGGKSLTYQLAAMLQPGVTLIVDPLVSLMSDQVKGLIRYGIDCCNFINSTQTKDKKQEVCDRLANSEFLYFFVTPERLCIDEFRSCLKNIGHAGVYFSYGVIDEVHCVSEWGHDFRFTYLHLGRNLYEYVRPLARKGMQDERISLFGLTATASFDVLIDVERELSVNNKFPLEPDSIVRFENTNRLELQYRVIKIPSFSMTENKWDIYKRKADYVGTIVKETLYNSFTELSKESSIERIKKQFLERENCTDKELVKFVEKANLNIDLPQLWYQDPDHNYSAIIFCPHTTGLMGVNDKKDLGIASRLTRIIGTKISTFTGSDRNNSRNNPDDFINNCTSIMVATKAFGMGIDKSNIRFTININHSGSPEAFVQEAGRAGRDRKLALAVILYSDFHERGGSLNNTETVDYGIHQYFYENSFPGIHQEKTIMYYMLEFLDIIATTEKENYNLWTKEFKGIMSCIKLLNPNDSIRLTLNYSADSCNFKGINTFLDKYKERHITFENFKNALSKSIYRMNCIGLISDFTQDYALNKFYLTVCKLPDGGYFDNLEGFLSRYYNKDKARSEVSRAKSFRGNNEIQKCLGFLTDFIYTKIAYKRRQAISDMEEFCRIGISNEDWLKTNEYLKDYLYYYFNSKFSRETYVTPSGLDYSLTRDTNHGLISSFEILKKYLAVIDEKVCQDGSPNDNVKHLQGSIRLIRRAVTDTNPSLNLLNVFCILYLNPQRNKHQQEEIESSYIDAAIALFGKTDSLDENKRILQWFLNELGPKNLKIISQQEILLFHKLSFVAESYIHVETINNIIYSFLDKWGNNYESE